MKYQPHDYQKYATQFIIDHPVSAILLQMGLGKSIITLTAIQQLLANGSVHNKYSRFAGNYVQFGNYQLRRTTDGGLAFKITDI